jgi:hypothetical protein
MSMSGTRECARCGGAIDMQGRCSVCGITHELNPTQAKSMPDNKAYSSVAGPGGELFSLPQTAKRDVKTTRTAFLFNKMTNERHPLTQSVSKIGRDQTNNIPLTADHYISRHHAWVLQMQGGYWVEDLGSTNGTLLNGEILNERKQIFPGDRLTFGKTELIFVVE